jgi:apolipoprotein N-acyltransferase
MTPRRGPRRGAVVLPALVGGVALALSLPPWGWWPLAFVGAAIIYWRLGGLRLRSRVLAGYLAGLGCFVPGLFWARAFNWYGAVTLIAVESLSMAVAAGLVPPGRGRGPTFVGVFTLAEALRMTWPFGGLPIGGVFLGQAGGPFLGLARVGGPLLLTGAVWAGGAALGQIARSPNFSSLPNGPPTGRRGWWRRGLTVAAVAVFLGTLVAAADRAPDGGRPLRDLQVAAVQGGGPRGYSKQQVSPDTVFAAQLAATYLLQRRIGHRRIDLVLWPEDVIALSEPLSGSPQAAVMSALARHLHTTLLAGVTTPAPGATFRNEIVAWGPNGDVTAVFEKVHRVPFGEYVPLRSFFHHFADLSGVPTDAVPGTGSGLLRTPAGPLGVLVSYEIFYADRGRPSVRAGAELLVVPTNTSSYATSQVPTQEIAAGRVQAVEEGRDLLQAAPTGYSIVVDHRGNLRARSQLSARGFILATVALRSGRTLYARAGDLPVLTLAAVVVVTGWLLATPWRRRSGRDGEGEPGGEDAGQPAEPHSPPAPVTPPLTPVQFTPPSVSELAGSTRPSPPDSSPGGEPRR